MAARWHIPDGGQNQRPGFGPGNRLIDFMDVMFIIDDTGDSGMVSIPLNQYTEERVAAEIQRRADTMLAVRNLGTQGQ